MDASSFLAVRSKSRDKSASATSQASDAWTFHSATESSARNDVVTVERADSSTRSIPRVDSGYVSMPPINGTIPSDSSAVTLAAPSAAGSTVTTSLTSPRTGATVRTPSTGQDGSLFRAWTQSGASAAPQQPPTTLSRQSSTSHRPRLTSRTSSRHSSIGSTHARPRRQAAHTPRQNSFSYRPQATPSDPYLLHRLATELFHPPPSTRKSRPNSSQAPSASTSAVSTVAPSPLLTGHSPPTHHSNALSSPSLERRLTSVSTVVTDADSPLPPAAMGLSLPGSTVIDWTHPATRRQEYARIDQARRGWRGVWNRVVRRRAPCDGGFWEEGGEHPADEKGSVRRYRLDLGTDDAASTRSHEFEQVDAGNDADDNDVEKSNVPRREFTMTGKEEDKPTMPWWSMGCFTPGMRGRRGESHDLKS